MGDADSEAIVQIPVQEIEAWMDEAEEVVDEGLENLLAFMTNLNGCIRSETKTNIPLYTILARNPFHLVDWYHGAA
ncbi:hypothetical protein TNCV_3468971 [Trichonephila clavipes]|nr:hypothetical protein TNCV_3468971 [Trichonephila clavipes]